MFKRCTKCHDEEGSLQPLKLLIYEHKSYCPHCLALSFFEIMAQFISSHYETKIANLEKENATLKLMLQGALNLKIGGKKK